MRIETTTSNTSVRIVLSERNCRALLAKLVGYPGDSACTIAMIHGVLGTVFVSIENDAQHYADRTPGVMHPVTERTLRGI